MKLPALISSNTAAKLEKAKAERDRVTATVAELRAKLDSFDVGSDDYGAASLTLDGHIRVHERAIEVSDRQIAGLETVLRDEEHRAAKARRAAGIVVVEKMLPEREKIIAEIETAIKTLPHLFEKLVAWRAKFVRQYPIADVEFPYAHFIDSDRVLRIVVDALRNIRAEDFHERIDGLAASEAEHHAALIADLKANPVMPTQVGITELEAA